MRPAGQGRGDPPRRRDEGTGRAGGGDRRRRLRRRQRLHGRLRARRARPFGEPIAKAFVDEALNEARKLENQLRTLRTERSVAVLHYSPITGTIEGEPQEIFQYLGSQRLCDPIDRFDHVKAVFHGHAHHGKYEGRTPRGTPVYNVAQSVLRPLFGKPYAVIEV